MSEDLIRYDILTQEALRGVIARALEEVQRAGLPGEHHFYVTFDTKHSGVKLSKRMRQRYPDEMTIILQHSFWNLEVGPTAFEIDLSFNDVRERLRVPFESVLRFVDPSVKFGLQFDKHGEEGIQGKPIGESPGEASESQANEPDSGEPEGDAPQAEESSASVVSLDSFRKKK